MPVFSLTSSALSLSLVAVCAAIILAANAFTSALPERSFAILAAATSYMSLCAASVAKPFNVVVISAEITPSVWRAASFTELIVSLSGACRGGSGGPADQAGSE